MYNQFNWPLVADGTDESSDTGMHEEVILGENCNVIYFTGDDMN